MTIHDDAQRGLIDRITETAIPDLINRLTTTERKRLSSLGLWHFNAELQITDTSREGKPLLRNDLTALASMDSHRGVLITIDEVSSGRVRMQEVSRLAMEVSHAIGNRAPIMIVFAGIKVGLDRLLGDYAWRASPGGGPISPADAEVARQRGVDAVLTRVISRAFDDFSDVDRQIVEAMAHDDGRTKITDLAGRLNKSSNYLNVYKRRLIDSGYIEADGRQHVRFSLPYLRDYIRAMARADDGHAEAAGTSPWEAYPPPEHRRCSGRRLRRPSLCPAGPGREAWSHGPRTA